jgi:GH15 family glucan-1,4-alpha-glucosidase
MWPTNGIQLGKFNCAMEGVVILIFHRFDLWEEVSSASFFTSAVQHRALRQGVVLAEKIGQTGVTGDWTNQANNILCFMQVGFSISSP